MRRCDTESGDTSSLPEVFCWTKFGAEAGEEAPAIFGRKEIERRLNGGIFLWGIGNSIGPSLLALLRETNDPRILFSPIRGLPAKRDAAPGELVLWCGGIGLDGLPFRMPDYSLVTGRGGPKARASHFALVCRRNTPISMADAVHPRLFLDEIRNLRTGSALGSSQVTSVVRRVVQGDPEGPPYPVPLQATLAYPFLVRLTRSLPIPEGLRLDRSGRMDHRSVVAELLRRRRGLSCCGGGDQLPFASEDTSFPKLAIPSLC